MKSSIKIDLDLDNNPILKINYQETDDLRDLAVKRLLEAIQHNGGILYTSREPFSLERTELTLKSLIKEEDADWALHQSWGVVHRNTLDKVEKLWREFKEDSDYDLEKLSYSFGAGELRFFWCDDTSSDEDYIKISDLMEMPPRDLRKIIRLKLQQVIEGKDLKPYVDHPIPISE